MKDVRTDSFVVLGDQPPRGFIEHDEAWRVGRRNLAMRVVDAVAGVEIEIVAVNEDRTVCRIVRVNTRANPLVVRPSGFGFLSDFGFRTSDLGLNVECYWQWEADLRLECFLKNMPKP